MSQQPDWNVPWPAEIRAGPGDHERDRLTAAFASGVRKTGILMQLMTQAAATRIGISATDLNCLNILSLGGQMTAGELARETGLATASVTGVLDRLEHAGFVYRERDVHDRRRVIIRLDTQRALAKVASVFGPVLHSWRKQADLYTDDELRLLVELYGHMEEILREHVADLRQK